jgi:hypothetical protein
MRFERLLEEFSHTLAPTIFFAFAEADFTASPSSA